VLCYQHHTEMLLKLSSEPVEKLLYVCAEPPQYLVGPRATCKCL